MKYGQQLAVRVLDGEIALLVAHDRDQDFAGQLQELVLEATEQRGRRFDQIGHFVEQPGVVEHVTADALRQLRHLIGDGGAAGVVIEDDVFGFERGEIVRRSR